MVRPQCRAALDYVPTALVLFPLTDATEPASGVPTRYPDEAGRGGSATAMSIPFAPEPEPVAEVLELRDDQSTGSLPLGFDFEFFGARYAGFDLSSDGLMTFRSDTSTRASGSYRRDRLPSRVAGLYSSIALGWSDLYPLRGRRVAYEVRGDQNRRRLVLSLTGTPHSYQRGVRRLSAQLVLYERTGMIDVHTRCEDAAGESVNREAFRFTTAPG
jgi:hypothetical protein